MICLDNDETLSMVCIDEDEKSSHFKKCFSGDALTVVASSCDLY